jgi:hypothetical protein
MVSAAPMLRSDRVALAAARMPRRHRMLAWASIWVAVVASAVGQGGCAGMTSGAGDDNGDTEQVSAQGPEVNSSLSALTRGRGAKPTLDAPEVTPGRSDPMAGQAGLDLDRIFREPSRGAGQSEDASASARDPDSGLGALGVGGGSTATPENPSEDPEPVSTDIDRDPDPTPAPTGRAEPEAPPADPLTDLASKMAGLLRQRGVGDRPVLTDEAGLLPIEDLAPGALYELTKKAGPLTSLTGEDQRTLLDARTRVLDKPDGVNERLVLALRGRDGGSLSIPRSVLATAVRGFGQFDRLPSTFVAGRAIPAIVYTELEGFTSRPARKDDPLIKNVGLSEQFAVEVAQTLSLFTDLGRDKSVLVWHRQPQRVVDVARNKRRDFYLIQQIQLPATLGVGKYTLKVTVADLAGAAQAETIIPIEIVADPQLVRPGG